MPVNGEVICVGKPHTQTHTHTHTHTAAGGASSGRPVPPSLKYGLSSRTCDPSFGASCYVRKSE
jgi:hypothetical protein